MPAFIFINAGFFMIPIPPFLLKTAPYIKGDPNEQGVFNHG